MSSVIVRMPNAFYRKCEHIPDMRVTENKRRVKVHRLKVLGTKSLHVRVCDECLSELRRHRQVRVIGKSKTDRMATIVKGEEMAASPHVLVHCIEG